MTRNTICATKVTRPRLVGYHLDICSSNSNSNSNSNSGVSKRIVLVLVPTSAGARPSGVGSRIRRWRRRGCINRDVNLAILPIDLAALHHHDLKMCNLNAAITYERPSGDTKEHVQPLIAQTLFLHKTKISLF